LHPVFLTLSGQALVSRLALHQLLLKLTLVLTGLECQLFIRFGKLPHLESLLMYQLVFLTQVVPQVPHFQGHQLNTLLVLGLESQMLSGTVVQLFLQEVLSFRS
jgi:hypothetical protein